METHTAIKLLKKAEEGLQKAYAPYSQFPVGAAIETLSGEIFIGCNVENAAYPAGICAERTALVSAVAQGYRQFSRLAILSKSDEWILPCGICLQMLSEFTTDLVIVTGRFPAYQQDEFRTYVLNQLLPNAFSEKQLGK